MYQVAEFRILWHIYFTYLLEQFLFCVWHESHLLSFCWTMFSAVWYYMESPCSRNLLMC